MGITFELSLEMLQPVITRLFGTTTSTAKEFDVVALKPGLGNPTSLGVYRVSGTADVDGVEQPFTAVVKHLANGLPMMDASKPTHWNYWKREIEFFESALVKRIPKSLDFPRYLGQTVLPDQTALFWNEDLGDLTKTKWTWEQCLNAASLAAELNSIDASDVDDYPWLNRTQPEGWLEFREGFFVPLFPKIVECAKAKPETAAALEIYGPYLPEQVKINAVMHSLRQCFTHTDFNLNNLVSLVENPTALIALDWQLAGIGPIGGEVASLFNTAHETGVIQATRDKFEEICAVYRDRFNQLNPDEPIDIVQVRLAAAAVGYFILVGVGVFLAQPESENTAGQNQAKIEGLVDYFTNGPLVIYAEVLTELL